MAERGAFSVRHNSELNQNECLATFIARLVLARKTTTVQGVSEPLRYISCTPVFHYLLQNREALISELAGEGGRSPVPIFDLPQTRSPSGSRSPVRFPQPSQGRFCANTSKYCVGKTADIHCTLIGRPPTRGQCTGF